MTISCQKESKSKFPILCDMETINEDHFLSNNNTLITNAKSQSNLYFRSGKYSAKINKENPFGLGCSFYDLKKGNQLIISVWEKVGAEKGYLKIVNDKHEVLKTVKSNGFNQHDGWELITFTYELTKNHNQLKFYIHNENINPAYYDDLNVELYETAKRVTLKNEHIDLKINSLDYQQLLKYRDEALRIGIISSQLKKYIKGNLTYKGKTIPIKLRFKGDWPDHLKSNKWSFRIQTKDNTQFKGLKSFSIQSPHTRSFLKEWIMHLIFKEQDVLTTRYGFISVNLNNELLGIYAYEEHFDKELLNYYNRENAPILKFNEEGLWETRLNNPKNKTHFPFYEAAEIMPFKKKRTLSSPKLSNELKKGSELMLKYKAFEGPISEIFDLKKVAKIYALNDIGKIRHSYHWHNQRFYYNASLNKLEHIAFDCYAGLDEGIEDVIYGYSIKETHHNNNVYLTKQFFNDSNFVRYYKGYLKEFSDEKFIDEIHNRHSYLSDSLCNLLKMEFPNYTFDLNYLNSNARAIRETLKVYDSTFSFNLYDINYDYNAIANRYFPSIGIKGFVKDNNLLTLKNFHLDTVEIIGYGINHNPNEMKKFQSSITLSPFKKGEDYLEIEFYKKIKYLFFKPVNIKEIQSCEIQKWPYDLVNL
ncbi:MAG: CotH kinase family protein [Flavobacteriales bacterium]|nr:CotH kinase family protein [Flavobacteriales bacterium]